MIRVMLVDDHELVRTGVRRLLDDFDDIDVVIDACSGEEALSLIRECSPDVVLMDVNMPGIGGVEATRKLLKLVPGLSIIAVTAHGEQPFPSRLLEAGAKGYITKECSSDEIAAAIRMAAKGEFYFSAQIAQEMAVNFASEGKSPFDGLSQREWQIMTMISRGDKVQEIADSLCLSPKTVSTYRYRLMEKLKVNTDVELTHLAIRHGIVDA
ncbi:MAG: response regulator [Gammaproteobacteria bacterium]|nr:response regulator [Gammaproteobacteria bacterium]